MRVVMFKASCTEQGRKKHFGTPDSTELFPTIEKVPEEGNRGWPLRIEYGASRWLSMYAISLREHTIPSLQNKRVTAGSACGTRVYTSCISESSLESVRARFSQKPIFSSA